MTQNRTLTSAQRIAKPDIIMAACTKNAGISLLTNASRSIPDSNAHPMCYKGSYNTWHQREIMHNTNTNHFIEKITAIGVPKSAENAAPIPHIIIIFLSFSSSRSTLPVLLPRLPPNCSTLTPRRVAKKMCDDR